MKKLQSLFGLLVIVVVLYGGWKVVPLYVANYELEDAMDSAARLGGSNDKATDDDLRNLVLREAASLNIPINGEHVVIEHAGFEVYVSGDYTAQVEIPVYPFGLHFQPMSRNKRRSMN
jgi:hypothetical protein